jgi:hypothetical protein
VSKLVDESLACVGAKNEVMIRTNQTHDQACDLKRDSKLFQDIMEFLAPLESQTMKAKTAGSLIGKRDVQNLRNIGQV